MTDSVRRAASGFHTRCLARRDVACALLGLGLILAACGPQGQSTPAANTGKPSAAAVKPGSVDSGRQLFLSQGCGGCHTIRTLQGAVGAVGPELTNVASTADQRVSGLSAAEYLRQSIADPDAFTVQGFQQGIMPKLPLNDQQVNDLVAFLLTLR